METYRKYLSFLAENRVDKVFINSDQDHALEVFVNIFQISKNIVRIFAGCLCSEVSNKPSYIKAVSDFIERGGEVKVLLNKYEESMAVNSNLIKRFAYYKLEGKPISIKKTSVKPHYANDPEKKEIHFTIGDDCAYRIETDVDKRTANCNFNNEIVAKNTAVFFDQIFDSQSSVELDLIQLFNSKPHGDQ